MWLMGAGGLNGVGRTVPVLYLDPGFPADLADRALRVAQIVRRIGDPCGPTPAASKSFRVRHLT